MKSEYFVNIFIDKVFKAKQTSNNAVLVDKFAFKTEDCKKIVITTDISLEYPTFTNEFLDLYVKAYNEGDMIQEVEVEYIIKQNNYVLNDDEMDIFEDYELEHKLNVNSDNTVNVKAVSNKTYTVAEVIEILYKYEKDNLYFGRDPYYNNVDITLEWIKQNLI